MLNQDIFLQHLQPDTEFLFYIMLNLKQRNQLSLDKI